MKNFYIKDLKKNDQLDKEQFVITQIKKNQTRAGDTYYRLEISDNTGSAVANIWKDNISNCEIETLEESDIVNLWGKVEDFKGAIQVNIFSLGIAHTDDYDIEDFVKISERNNDEMWSEFKNHVSSIENEHLKKLLNSIFGNKEILEKYRIHPAAEKVHHAFQGGLLEHVLEMLDLSEPMFKYYPMADKSLVKAGIILHDIGKLEEIDNNKISFSRTKTGNLLGHIIQGYEIVEKHEHEDFPEELMMKLKHIILSHHGILEYGSPVMPMTIEAIIVSQLDDASSKTRQYHRIMKENEGKDIDFSDRDFFIGTKVYLN